MAYARHTLNTCSSANRAPTTCKPTGKPFAAVSMPYRFHKLRDLAAAVGAERHLLWEPGRPGEVGTLLAEPLDPAVDRTISALRARSNAYLDVALA